MSSFQKERFIRRASLAALSLLRLVQTQRSVRVRWRSRSVNCQTF